MATGVTVNANQAREQTGQLRHQSPNIFNSGNFVLAALDGANPRLRRQAGQAVDLERGGQAATVTIFSKYTFNTPGSIALSKTLENEADGLAEESGLNTGVAGGAAKLNQYSKVSANGSGDRRRDHRRDLPVLVLIFRAIPLAAIAAGLNLAPVLRPDSSASPSASFSSVLLSAMSPAC